jgi:hypothetical protein
VGGDLDDDVDVVGDVFPRTHAVEIHAGNTSKVVKRKRPALYTGLILS